MLVFIPAKDFRDIKYRREISLNSYLSFLYLPKRRIGSSDIKAVSNSKLGVF